MNYKPATEEKIRLVKHEEYYKIMVPKFWFSDFYSYFCSHSYIMVTVSSNCKPIDNGDGNSVI